jgi:ABC-type antimicrobial peptide transport system permease subunit
MLEPPSARIDPKQRYPLGGSNLFYLTYMLAELRRRKGRTLLTALGLAVGVGLVVTVTALSNGLDRAQDKVLKPLTGVGTDMSVTRPLTTSGSGSNQSFRPGPGGPRLSTSEQRALRRENGGARFGLQNLGNPGQRFTRDNFTSTSQLSFPESKQKKIAGLAGVESTAGALTLSNVHISGTVPKQSQQRAPGIGGGGGPPRNINFKQTTVSGIDTSKSDLGLITPSEIRSGSYFNSGKHREAILTESYARREQIKIGDNVKLGGKSFEVVGLAKLPLGGQASDIYVRLGELQKFSDREGRINVLQVRATDSSVVSSVSSEIEKSFSGSQVTTAKQLADRVSGSLVDAKNLSGKLGTALAIVGLAAAFLIAGFLTLSSVNKRTRELGTLKAIGWRQRLVVRQVTAESLAQGALGGLLGALLGLGGAALASAVAPTLEATVASAGGGGPFGFGQAQVASGSSHVALDAPVDVSLLLLAVGLALLGGLISGVVGGVRAARLRPAEALRSVE